MALISADPQVMHGQAVIAGTRVPVSVILDCLAAGMAAEEIVAEYPAVSTAGVRGGRLRRGAGARRAAAAAAVAVKFKLDENLPVSSGTPPHTRWGALCPGTLIGRPLRPPACVARRPLAR
jgi:uncharacterized protein DUF433